MTVKPGFKLRPLGEDYILVGESVELVNFNKMITMNETAAFLWNQVSDGRTFDAAYLASRLTDEYEVSPATALTDSEATIQSWINAGIIE